MYSLSLFSIVLHCSNGITCLTPFSKLLFAMKVPSDALWMMHIIS